MDDSYKSFECYTHMSDNDKGCFNKLVEYYSPFLGNGKTENATSTRFTLHDFEHHCVDLFKYISEVISYEFTYLSITLHINKGSIYFEISLSLGLKSFMMKKMICQN